MAHLKKVIWQASDSPLTKELHVLTVRAAFNSAHIEVKRLIWICRRNRRAVCRVGLSACDVTRQNVGQ